MREIQALLDRLAALRARVRAALLLEGGARVAGTLLLVVGASFLLDRVFRLETAARAVLLAGGLAGLGLAAWSFLVRRAGAVPGEEALAVAVERSFPELADRLISAVQLSREPDPERWGMSPQLVEDAVKGAIEPASRVRFRDVLDGGKVARAALLGALALALLAGAVAADPESAGIWFSRNVLLRDVRWPQKTYLVVDPDLFPGGVARVVRGSDLVVTALSTGEVHPDRVTILYEDREGDRGRAGMKADVERPLYRHEFKSIAFPIAFHLEGGDEVTREYRIELMEAPEVDTIAVEIGFPDYAERAPVPVDLSQGDPEMLLGGYVRVRGTATKDLRSAAVVYGESDAEGEPARLTGPRGFEFELRPRGTVLCGIRLRDTDGLSNPTLAPRFLVRVVEDRAPRVGFRKEGIGTVVVEGAVIPWTARIRDDVKVVAARIEVLRSAGDRQAPEPHNIPVGEGRLGTESCALEGRIEVKDLGALPGAFLTFTAFASDNALPAAHEGKSDGLTVKVVTLEEFFSEITRRQQELRRAFEELIEKERRLRDRFRDMRDQPPADPQELRLRLEGQGQEQREIARRVQAVERGMAQVLDEMMNNRVYDQGRIQELQSSVVRALENLRTAVMGGHAERLDREAKRAAALDVKGNDGADLERGYDGVLKAMEAVLANMIKIEGFTEIIERVRGILKAHGDVKDATRAKYEAVMREIFEDDPKKEGGR